MSDTSPTLFLPGALGRRSFWEPVATRLIHAGHKTLFAWPGFGDEPVEPAIGSLDDLHEWFAERAPHEPSNVVAQSMGGAIAMRYAIAHPERVRRLVLVTTSDGTSRRWGVDWRAAFRSEHPSLPDWFERDATALDTRLPAVRVPTLLIFGDADPLAPPATGEYLRALLAGSRLVVIPGGTHDLAVDHAADVARVIDAHLA